MTLARWERAAELPLTVAAVAFLAAYAWPILDVDRARGLVSLCGWVATGTWTLFALDYLVRLTLAPERWLFVRRNVTDLAIVALPLLRPLRLLRLLTVLNVLNRLTGGSLRGRVAVFVGGASLLILFVSALAVLEAERGDPAANIATFGDAVWWSMTTVTTVGYGDRFPVTGTGRLVAAALMLAGIAQVAKLRHLLAGLVAQRPMVPGGS